ncbi:MAG: CRISPR-associated helicase Cas3', partial [Halothece sp.]
RSRQVDDYRVVELFSMLQDYVYGADLTCKPTYEKGLIVTRSWTPSATLVYDDGQYSDLKDMPQITVPLDRLILHSNGENKYANTHVYERYYDKENTCWKTKPLSWGVAYKKDILIKIHPNKDGVISSDFSPEYSYDPELGFVYLPGLFIKLNSKGKQKNFEQKLLHHYNAGNQTSSVIITYIKALER